MRPSPSIIRYYFNSRPHGGRRKKSAHSNPPDHFNSRPHGGRHLMRCSIHIIFYFNSRPHGGRHGIVMHRHELKSISTHALTEGDTKICALPSILSFQLTPSRRATVRSEEGRAPKSKFQLTPSRRATANLDKFFF